MSGKSKTISLRLSTQEFAHLNEAIGNISQSAYIRAVLFDQPLQRIQVKNKTPVADHAALGKVLAKLGQTRISQNLNQIAHAVNSGLVLLPEESTQSLNAACADIHEMRHLINVALGKKAGS